MTLKLGVLSWLMVFWLYFIFVPPQVLAQTKLLRSPFIKATPEATVSASMAPDATPSASANIVIPKKEDITAPTAEITDKLARYLAENPVAPLTVTNALQHAIRKAVSMGVPANTIVLVLLFPIIATLIVVSRHWIGIRGFGIFLPAVLSVVFVATGIIEGLLLFLIIIGGAMTAKPLVKKIKVQYLPRTALILWFVSLCVLAALFLAPFLNLKTITTISIFPILILILLVENFMDIQSGMSLQEAINMTIETLGIALVCSLVLELDFLQKLVLIYPEVTVILTALVDIFMGKYVGLRLLEYKKFKELVK